MEKSLLLILRMAENIAKMHSIAELVALKIIRELIPHTP
jgi:hypothetical protein